MSWDRPLYIIIVFFLPLFVLLLLLRERKRKLTLMSSIKEDSLVRISWKMNIFKRLLLSSAVLFLLLTLAGPKWGRVWQKISKPGRDVIFVVDTSISMQSEDIKPTRMSAAKEKIKYIIENISGFRVGIVFFAGTAFLNCPVTFDKNAVKLFLNEAWDNLIPLPGSNIEQALKLASESFPSSKKIARRYVVLITDGEELQGDVNNITQELDSKGISVISFGIGEEEGSPLPIYENSRLVGYKKNSKGEIILSKLNKEMLKKISDDTDGVYIKYRKDITDISRIIDVIQKGKTQKQEDSVIAGKELRYQLFLLIAILLLMLEMVLSERVKQ
ncbi:VWA domain-containing protein [Elusimicrobiota bacterium]